MVVKTIVVCLSSRSQVRILSGSQNAVIAQLVERYLGMVKVIGSSPIGGSKKNNFVYSKRLLNL